MYMYRSDELLRLVLRDMYQIYNYNNQIKNNKSLTPNDGFYLFEQDGNIGKTIFLLKKECLSFYLFFEVSRRIDYCVHLKDIKSLNPNCNISVRYWCFYKI